MTERLLHKNSASKAVSERELVERLRSRDSEAMRLFYERYAGFLTAVCSRYVPERADVKDILQDVLLQIFDAAGRFEYRGEGSLKAWASRITVNRALKWLRAQGRLRSMESLPEVAEEEVGDVEKVPPAVLQSYIRELPDGYRTVFNLFVFEKKSHREISALLGIKEDSSASQYFRARAQLAKKINQYLKDHE